VHISITAFLICLVFALALGYIFAWIYNYGKLHKDPEGEPQKITDTLSSPVPLFSTAEYNNSALKRLEQEKIFSETDFANRDAFIKKLLMLFRSRLEKENDKILSICYWVFNGEGFALRLSNSTYRLRENLFVSKDNKYFSRRDFNWNGIDEAPIDVFHSEEQITRSVAGSAVTGEGKFHGYITIDSAHENAFDDEICIELRELANVAEEMLRNLDMNYKLNRENNLFYGMLRDISNLFSSVSKGNLISNLSKILQDNFKSNRMMIIIPAERDKEKWLISEAVGMQSEKFNNAQICRAVRSNFVKRLHNAPNGSKKPKKWRNIGSHSQKRKFAIICQPARFHLALHSIFQHFRARSKSFNANKEAQVSRFFKHGICYISERAFGRCHRNILHFRKMVYAFKIFVKPNI